MILPKNICPVTKIILSLIKNKKNDLLMKQISAYSQSNQMNFMYNQKFCFSILKKNIVPPEILSQDTEELNEIKDKIETMYLKLNENEDLKSLEKIIYPEALLHGQEDISKLSKLYDQIIAKFEVENPDKSGIEQLIKAGDFYMKMNGRRLKALKPYQRAKEMIEAQSLQETPEGETTYRQLCNNIGALIKQEIVDGECSGAEEYFKKGLEEEREGNELESIYYFHKGICISEYQSIPDKLLHFNLQAHYLFLSEIMRPTCPELKEDQKFDESIKKYNELEELGKKWFKEELRNTEDYKRKKDFENAMIWVCSNKGDIYYRAHKYLSAVQCYEKVIDFCKTSKSVDDRIKIVRVIENLQKSYDHLGFHNKAIDFLEWAHDFVKDQISESPVLKSRYLKPIDEMLISFYEKNKRKDKKEEDDSYDKRINKIQLELKEIVG